MLLENRARFLKVHKENMQVITQTTKNWMRTPIVLATVIATIAMLTGAYFMVYAQNASAAALTSVKDTLSDSRPGIASNHTILFTTPSGLANGNSFTITFPAGFDTASIVEDDVDVSGSTFGEFTTAADCSGTENASAAMASDILTVTMCAGDGGSLATGETVTVEIGDNATASGTGSNQITNPTDTGTGDGSGTSAADTYSIDIDVNSGTDTGSAMVAVIDGVDVSVTVDESLSFSIDGIASGSCTYATGGSKVGTNTDPPTIPYGSASVNTLYDGCLQFTVGTNASNGYSTTIEKTQLLTSGSDTIADGTCDGACTATDVAPWNTATNNGFGYCMTDSTGDAAGTADPEWGTTEECGGAAQGFKIIPTTGGTAEPVMSSAGPTPSGNDVSQSSVRLSVPGNQAAGTYSTTLVYVTTPTF